MALALCRLQAASHPLPPQSTRHGRAGPAHAWPQLLLAPLSWLPHSTLNLGPKKLVLPSGEQLGGRAFNSLTTLELKLHSSHKTKEEDAKGAALLSSLRGVARVAVCEARAEEALASAARRDVAKLRAVLERLERAAQRHLGGTYNATAGSGCTTAWEALSTRAAPVAQQLRERRAWLRQAEHRLVAELRDVEQQCRRLESELQRRERRVATATVQSASTARAGSQALPAIAATPVQPATSGEVCTPRLAAPAACSALPVIAEQGG